MLVPEQPAVTPAASARRHLPPQKGRYGGTDPAHPALATQEKILVSKSPSNPSL